MRDICCVCMEVVHSLEITVEIVYNTVLSAVSIKGVQSITIIVSGGLLSELRFFSLMQGAIFKICS